MDDAILENRLNDLLCYVNSIQIPRPANPIARSGNSRLPSDQRRNNIPELLASLGLSVKYLLFDLEATRRENALLRSILTDDNE